MELTPDVQDQLDAIIQRRAFAQLDARVFEVAGPDAQKWLNDLVTAGIHRLDPGDSRESLLLDATGRIKCHFLVGRTGQESYVLVQTTDQPEPVAKLIARYVLSSKVTVTDVTGQTLVFRVPPGTGPPASWAFSGETFDVAGFPSNESEAKRAEMTAWLTEAHDGFEALRIALTTPRFPVDFAETSVPAEAGWDEWMVDTTKGCFLGQESVAKIRNRGRPPFRVVPLGTEALLEAGDPVFLGGTETGTVTSSLTRPEGSQVIARIRWFADGATPDLHTRDGAPLVLSDRPANFIL